MILEETLPSYKYVIVLHQLSARMGENSNRIGEVLNTILMRCASDHPYHTLPVLLAQALMHKDKEFVRGGSMSKKPVEVCPIWSDAFIHAWIPCLILVDIVRFNLQNDRVLAARRLVESCKKQASLGELAGKMEQVWNSLINLANVQETKNTDNTRREIPPNAPIRKLKGMDIVPIPTTSMAVNQYSKYKDFVIGKL